MVLHEKFLYVSSIACPDLCIADKKKVDHVVWMQHGHVVLHRRKVETENMPVDGSDVSGNFPGIWLPSSGFLGRFCERRCVGRFGIQVRVCRCDTSS